MNKLQSNCMYQCVNLLSVISLYQNFSVLIIGGKKKKKKKDFSPFLRKMLTHIFCSENG